MRFQCTFCFTIIPITDPYQGQRIPCPNCGKSIAVPRSNFEVGCVIDDFVIEGLIGKGGMAAVYRARQLSMNRPVALKILARDFLYQERFKQAFLREAKAAARINHPNLVQAYAVGYDEGALFYAMEYVAGVTLGTKVERERVIQIEPALNITQQCAEALHAAYTQENLIHRDIKPDNIMLSEDGYAKVMDLGIAVTVEDAVTADACGTPAYMAPEQFRREALDCRTDIYALGVTLFNVVTGFVPFEGTTQEVAEKHCLQEVAFPKQELIPIPARVRRLITRMMAKEPADRYQDYDELLSDIVAVRKRLARSEELVPSVHTISFSKYRLHGQPADSPSQVYRKRSEMRQKVAIAKEAARQVPVPQPASRFSAVRRALIVGLSVLVCGLGLALVVLLLTRSSPFAEDARKFLSAHPPGAIANLGGDQLTATAGQAQGLLDRYPAYPRRQDETAYFSLQHFWLELRERQFLLELRQVRTALEERSTAELRQLGHGKQNLDLALAEVQRARRDISDEADRVHQLTLGLEERIWRLDERLAGVERDSARVSAYEERFYRGLNAALWLRVGEALRMGSFEDLGLLFAGAPEDPPTLRDFKQEMMDKVDLAGALYKLVYDSGAALAGTQLPAGQILSIEGDTVKLLDRASGNRATAELSALSAAQLIAIAETVWRGPAPKEEANLAFALAWGDFPAVEKLARPQDLTRFRNLAVDCYDQMVTETRDQLAVGNRNLALAKAKMYLGRYGDVPEFKRAAAELAALLRARTDVLRKPAPKPPATP